MKTIGMLPYYASKRGQHSVPKDEAERQVIEARAAFPDSLYFDDGHLTTRSLITPKFALQNGFKQTLWAIHLN